MAEMNFRRKNSYIQDWGSRDNCRDNDFGSAGSFRQN